MIWLGFAGDTLAAMKNKQLSDKLGRQTYGLLRGVVVLVAILGLFFGGLMAFFSCGFLSEPCDADSMADQRLGVRVAIASALVILLWLGYAFFSTLRLFREKLNKKQ